MVGCGTRRDGSRSCRRALLWSLGDLNNFNVICFTNIIDRFCPNLHNAIAVIAEFHCITGTIYAPFVFDFSIRANWFSMLVNFIIASMLSSQNFPGSLK
jgi:hypothetical protein